MNCLYVYCMSDKSFVSPEFNDNNNQERRLQSRTRCEHGDHILEKKKQSTNQNENNNKLKIDVIDKKTLMA